jgi:hypothetical protein
MPWIIAAFVVLMVTALALLFTVSARTIQGDVNRRFKDLGVRLENDATSVLANLIELKHSDGAEPKRPDAGSKL